MTIRTRTQVSKPRIAKNAVNGKTVFDLTFRIYFPDGSVRRSFKRCATRKEALEVYQTICEDVISSKPEIELRARIGNMTIGDLLNDYLERTAAHQAPETQRQERVFVRNIMSGMNKNTRMSEVTEKHISDYITSRRHKPTAARAELRILKNICEEAIERGLIEKSPTRRIKAPRKADVKIKYMTAEETAIVLQKAKEMAQKCKNITKMCYDSYVWVYASIAVYTGARPCEILTLRLRDFDFDTMTVCISASKTGRIRVVGISEEVKEAITHFIQNVSPRSPDEPFFQSWKEGGRIDMRRTWERLTLSAIGRTVTRYTARHTFGRLVVLSGAPANVAQNLLGHSTLAMTTRYTQLGSEAARMAIDGISSQICKNMTNDSTNQNAPENKNPLKPR